MQVYVYWQTDNIGLDSHAYWLAAREPETWYTRPPAYRDAFLYSPAFGQALRPLGVLPWPAFQAVWFLGCAAILVWLLAPLGWKRGLILAPFFVSELLLGNVYLLFAASLVLSLGRFPGAVALPILTKVAPGVVGLWFVAGESGGKSSGSSGRRRRSCWCPPSPSLTPGPAGSSSSAHQRVTAASGPRSVWCSPSCSWSGRHVAIRPGSSRRP